MRCRWEDFSNNVLPPSQDIADFVEQQGSRFYIPLGEYLYGPSASGFWHLRGLDMQQRQGQVPRLLTTSFVGGEANRATLVDKALQNVVGQLEQTVEWRGSIGIAKKWVFDSSVMMSNVIVDVDVRYNFSAEERAADEKKRKYKFIKAQREGTVIAYCNNDINDGPLYKVRAYASCAHFLSSLPSTSTPLPNQGLHRHR